MNRGNLLRHHWRALLAVVCVSPLLFILSINLLIQRPPLPPEPSEAPTIAYFAYGSNMNARYLTRVRGVTRVSSEGGVLQDYAVSFDLGGISGIEPAFANLAPGPGSTAHGVVHQLSADEFDKIVGSEGSNYEVQEVEVQLHSGSTVIARTLISAPSLAAPTLPSRRYLGYLHEAAIDYDFPPQVVETYNPANGAYIPVLSEVAGAVIHTMVWLAARL